MNQTSPLENLVGPGKPLHKEPPDKKEIAGLIGSGNARLKDSENVTLALESRFDLSYNAAHALCLAALRRQGYRSGNRYIVFQALQHTLGLSARRLPRQVDNLKVEISALSTLGRYASGVFLPRDS
jgi:hypothetical protein